MREIKFRAWDKLEKRMMSNSFVRQMAVGYFEDNGSDGLYHIIMQYTGLADKNRKKIYEGDIVNFKYHKNQYRGKIVFDEKTCGFELWFNTVVGAYGEMATHKLLICHCDVIEVIGNIYENPELLEGSDAE